MPLVQRSTCTLHYDDLGPRDAHCVLLMPSLLCDAAMFAHLAQDLAHDHRVLHLELRGHGRSSAPSKRFTQEDQAQDAVAVLDHAGVRSATMVGLSQGGFTAMRAAIHYRSRVDALVILNSSAARESAFNRAKYMALAASVLAVGVTEPVAKTVVPLMFSETFMRSAPHEVERFKDRWKSMDRRGLFYAVDAVANRTDLRPQLKRITCPTLVIEGGADRALPAPHSKSIVDGIVGAQHALMADAGHLSSVEQPDRVRDLVREFLSKNPVRSVYA